VNVAVSPGFFVIDTGSSVIVGAVPIGEANCAGVKAPCDVYGKVVQQLLLMEGMSLTQQLTQ